MTSRSRTMLFAIVWGGPLGFVSTAAQAQAANSEAIIITGVNSRLPPSLETFPGSVTVINKEQVQTQLSISTDVGALLAQNVPGLSTQSYSASDFAQTLRGRSLAYYIDGIPISNPLREGAREMRTVPENALASVEVIRGASALYGNGGNGGAVNYITTRPTGPDGVTGETELSVGASLTHLSDSSDPRIQQDLQVIKGPFDLIVSGSVEETTGFYDAQGDRIVSDPTGNGGITDSRIYNLYAKGGFNHGPHRLEASYMVYNQVQDTDWGNVILGNEQAGIKSRPALGQVDPRVVPQFTRNYLGELSYLNSDFLGGTARLQGYRESNSQRFSWNAVRQSQSMIQSHKDGARLDFNTPLSRLGLGGGQVLWGVEYIRDQTVQTVNTTPVKVFVPQIDQKDYAEFIQIESKPLDPLTIQAGVRHDNFKVNVPDFTVLTTGLNAQGGELAYAATVFNVGASGRLNKAATVYAGFSQGFSVPDIGLAIRATKVVNPLVALRPQAVQVNNYEIGLRGTVSSVHYSLALFESTSRLGQTFIPDPTDPRINIVLRAAERIRGIEATVDGTLLDGRMKWGGTFTKVTGMIDTNGDGKVDAPLPNDVIGPIKITGYVAYRVQPDWTVRIQGIYSGERNAFPLIAATSIGNNGHIHPFTTFDLYTSHKAGRGELSLAVTNVFNRFYFPVTSQLSGNRPDRYVPAPGAGVRIGYRIKY